MPLDFPAVLIQEKNKLATSSAWLWILSMKFSGEPDYVYFVRNTESITFEGNSYIPAPFEIDTIKDSREGTIETLILRFPNVNRALEYYLETLSGAIGTEVTLSVINSAHLDAGVAITRTFNVVSSEADANYVTLGLGAPNPILQRFPLRSMIADYCDWEFKGYECKYAGASTACNHTLANCRTLGNATNFGGFPGMGSGGIRVV